MEALSIKEIIKATDGVLLSGSEDMLIYDISTDSRRIGERSLFIPLKGENFDGHSFVQTAFNSGAMACITHSDLTARFGSSHEGKSIIKVANTSSALRDIAKYYREKFQIPFIGITGSVGKTTTKDMVACVLEQKYKVLKTKGNFNNEIGVPLTVFELEHTHEIGVLEMGMSGFGEISRLARIVQPETGIITNIGLAHVENLGSKENILKAKLEMFENFKENGLAVLNGDDPLLYSLKGRVEFNVKYFGINNDKCDMIAQNITKIPGEGVNFDVVINGDRTNIKLPIAGEHNVYNALAAIVVGLTYSVDMNDIIEGLNQFKTGKMRMEIFESGGVKVIDDCYNASPASMEAAIKILKDTESKNRRIAILGDMLEMGEWAPKAHKDIGVFAAGEGIDFIITVGKNAKNIAIGALQAGIMEEKVLTFETNQEVISFIKSFIKPLDIVLVKGSRGMKMEEISLFLRGVG